MLRRKGGLDGLDDGRGYVQRNDGLFRSTVRDGGSGDIHQYVGVARRTPAIPTEPFIKLPGSVILLLLRGLREKERRKEGRN